MFDRLVQRRSQVTAVCLTVCLIVPVAVAAFRADGFTRTKVDLNDAGIWVVRRGEGDIGRVNTQIGVIEVAFASLSQADDVLQLDDTVLVVDTADGPLARVDVAAAVLSENAASFPAGSSVSLGGPSEATYAGAGRAPRVAAVAAPNGRVWVADADAVADLRPEVDKPQLTAGKGSVTVVDVTGTARVYDAKSKAIIDVAPSGRTGRRAVDVKINKPAITTVGRQVVLLDRGDRRLVLPGGGTVDLRDRGTDPVLQQPGPDGDRVLVATSRQLLAVDLDDGAVAVVHDDARGPASAPVRLGDCVYGAWSGGSASSVRRCEGRDAEVTDGETMAALGAPTDLVFRVNRDRILLNDLATGANVLFTPDEPVVVNDWSQAENDEEDETDQPKELENEAKECQDDPPAPVLKGEPLRLGARAGRPVVVPVLDDPDLKVDADPCDVLSLVVTDPPPSEVAQVDVVADGEALQITPTSGESRTFEVRFSISGKGGVGDGGRIQVVVHPEADNSPPEAILDETVLVPGSRNPRVVHDVLLNDTDPEGDGLTLLRAWPGDGATDVTVRYQPTGVVTVSAGSAAMGTKQILYEVQDDHGSEPIQGELLVELVTSGDNEPTPNPDRVSAVVGREISLDVLANDTDLDGDPLTVASFDAPEAVGASEPEQGSGRLVLRPTTAAGSPFFFPYEVSDGTVGEPVAGVVRVDVLEATGDHPPVAVRDDAVARPGIPALADLTGNDLDLDGDVLAVTGVTPDDPESEVSVEVLELRVARVTAPAGFDRTETFTYTVTDGTTEGVTTGKLVVRPNRDESSNLAPIVAPDAVTLRAGTASAVPVLVNDVDPEGEQLGLVPVLREDQQSGDDVSLRAFVVRDELRVVASADAEGTYQVGYTAIDPGETTEDGVVTVTILGTDQVNRPPTDPRVSGRARSGGSVDIDVPLVGLDPDGDAVGITGVASPPAAGQVSVRGGTLTYQSDAGASGADEFTYVLDDGRGGRTSAVARLVVLPRSGDGSAPVAVADDVAVEPGASRVIDVLLNDTDADDDELSMLTEGTDAPTQPRRGSIVVADGQITYTQDGSLDGGDTAVGVSDSFTYGITDGTGRTARGIVSIDIRDDVPNVAPIARDDLVDPQAPGGLVPIEPLANDVDPDDPGASLLLEIPDLDRIQSETGARISVDRGEVEVKVAAGEPRPLAFAYTVTDAEGDVAQAVISIPVVADLPPVAEPDTATVAAGKSVTIDVTGNDTDAEAGWRKGQGISLVKTESARGGTTGKPSADGSVTFTAAREVRGSAGFAYEIVDEGGQRAWGYVSVTVEGQNFAPTMDSTEATVSAGGETRVDLAALADDDNPADLEKLAFSDLSGDGNGVTATLTGSRNQTLVITADATARGKTALLTVRVTDGAVQDNEGEGSIEVTVSEFEGLPPQAVDDASRIYQGDEVTLDVTGNDDPGAEGPLEIVGQPTSPSGRVSVGGNGTELTFAATASPAYGDFTVTYTVGDGTDDPDRRSTATWRITVIGRPDPPSAPSGVPESKQVQLRWEAPNANGAGIEGYLVEASPGGRRQEAQGTTHTFTGLENGVAYTFRVLALNEATRDEGQRTNWSAPSAPFTPDELPGTPTAPTVVFEDQAIAVTWAEPSNEGTDVEGYELQIMGDANEIRPLGRVTSYTWTGLTNGNTYSFKVRAKNRKGLSEFSPASGTEQPAGQPAAPVDVQAVRAGDAAVGGAVQLSWAWSRPGQGNGADILGFTVTATGAGGRTYPESIPAQGGDGRYTFTADSLRNGTSYTFQVVARTKVTQRSPAGSTSFTPAKAPNAPGAPSGTEGDGTSDLSFTAPAADASGPGNGGRDITRYVVTSDRGGRWEFTGTSGPATGLENGVPHRFKAQACNEVECGPEGTFGNPVNPYGVPDAPTGPTYAPNGYRINWAWGAPGFDGGRSITGYQYEIRRVAGRAGPTSNSGDTDAGTRSLTFDAGGHYELRARAVNARGAGPWTSWGGADTRSYTVTKTNRSAAGEASTEGGLCGPQCRWMNVELRNLRPNTAYEVSCRNQYKTNPNGGPYQSRLFTATTDGNGNYSSDRECFYGYTGTPFWVHVDLKDSPPVVF